MKIDSGTTRLSDGKHPVRSHFRVGVRSSHHHAARSRPGHRFSLRGFTIIELLVVVAIISLLVSILVPSLRRAMTLARTSVCMSQLRGFAMAGAFYGVDNADHFTYYWGLLTPSLGPPWVINYNEYLEQSEVAEDSIFTCSEWNASYTPATGNLFHRTYTINLWATWENLYYNAAGIGGCHGTGPGRRPKTASDVESPSEMVRILDGAVYRTPSGSIYYPEGVRSVIAGNTLENTDITVDYAVPHLHNRGSNLQFVDGHVSHMSLDVFVTYIVALELIWFSF